MHSYTNTLLYFNKNSEINFTEHKSIKQILFKYMENMSTKYVSFFCF